MLIEKIKRKFWSRRHAESLITPEFHLEFYKAQSGAAVESKLDCARHYLDEGWQKGFDPAPYFSTQHYLENNLDVKTAGSNPFVHYLLFGQDEGRAPHPNAKAKQWQHNTLEQDLANLASLDSWRLMEIIKPHFDFDHYDSQVDTSFETVDSALLHFINYGERENLNPNGEFKTAYYRNDNKDLDAADFNLFAHYLIHGKNEGRRSNDTHLLRFKKNAEIIRDEFDTEFYISQNPNLTNYASDPVMNFLEIGYSEGLNPNKDFNSNFYKKMNPDLAYADINGYVHYLAHGRRERRSPKPYFENSDGFYPLVTVIIPNYNHARFLPQRLASVVGQAYKNIEIIILDDCSSDDSRKVINELVEKYPNRNIKTHFNETNSGGVFNQWSKGMSLASGDYIWICESDDFCELDFLGTLMPYFADRSVNIAFGRIQFADSKGEFMAGMDSYRERSEAGIWDEAIKRPAKTWFSNGFGVNNVIANVGGCVFRKPHLSKNIWDKAKTFKIAGDWFLYIYIASGGQIAFDPKAIAYFRQHEKNTSGSNLNKLYFYNEIANVAREINVNWEIPKDTRDKFLQQAQAQFDHWKMSEQGYVFEDIFSNLDEPSERKLHILVGFIGFTSGGGEVFAINLANALRDQGHIVSMLAINMQNINPSMYARLHGGIAVYSSGNLAVSDRATFLQSAGVSLIHSNVVGIESLLFQFDRQNKIEVPYLVTLHGSYDGMNTDRAEVTSLLNLTVKNVSRWIYTANKNKDIFAKADISTRAFKKIDNAMPADERPYHKTRSELGIPEDAFVFTFVARGVEGKGWDVMIKTFQKFQKTHGRKAVHLVLVGNGEVAEKAVKKIRKNDSISYLGYESEINGIYRMSDCAVVPTRFVGESFPLCVVQAAQEDLPIIATDHGEIKAMLTRGKTVAGELIDFDTNTTKFGESLLSAMETVYTNDAHRAKLVSNLSKVKEKFEMSKMIAKYEAAYDKASETYYNAR